MVSIGIALIPYFKTEAVRFAYGNETYYDCREMWDEEAGKHYTLFIFIVTFALPISVLTFVYTSICWYILRHNTPGNPDRVRDLAQWKLKIKVVKMLITIVILFAVCWLPIHIFNIIVWFFPPNINNSRTLYMTYVFSYFFSHFLSMSHSFINPFVYGFMSENFKTKKVVRVESEKAIDENAVQTSAHGH
ncbi:unnamed protein product [Oppiella nova]|uniref:G-protein coupled receptors family 1 profile domain-containing protein n=1 Tax=Oppiella nova TaxID=334625 RepID=A0A7R9MHC3_9ACAR|nr:unnamed protein product [Oppiella nova]CAG2177408.1 unnamed protein product [Oppiella nova]